MNTRKNCPHADIMLYMTEIVQKDVYGDQVFSGLLAFTTRIIYIGLPQAKK
jgi:hypothetical protein